LKITIVRHAQPIAVSTGLITPAEFGDWISSYNESPLPSESAVPTELETITRNSGGIVCSDLRRSIETAELLDASNIILKSALFKEADLPYAARDFIKLPASVWAALFRAMWVAGYSSNAESHGEARLRARTAAAELQKFTRIHKHIVYIGHGIFNRMVVRELLSSGWQGPKHPSSAYWGHAIYELPGE